jgi:thioredoxin reductase (NADPH)
MPSTKPGTPPASPYDAIVIGAGPAGLVGATYLARYRRHILVVDGGSSRAALIPESHNVPGFPSGISGPHLLDRLREQARTAGVRITRGTVTGISLNDGIFQLAGLDQPASARAVLLATGMSDLSVPAALPAAATWRGLVRWCPICDGYESSDRRIVLAGDVRSGPGHARFLRTYTRDLTLVLTPEDGAPSDAIRAELEAEGITVIEGMPEAVTLSERGGTLRLASGREVAFEVFYPMNGGVPHAGMATTLGARCGDDGRLAVDRVTRETSVSGLYAAGDVVASLNQICVATAEAALAATAIHAALPPNPR